MLSEQILKEWTDALRSGEYKQGRRYLYTPEEKAYCCLGVLCKINNIEIRRVDALPSQEAEIKIGLPGKMSRCMALLNDGFRTADKQINQHTFTEISSIIESKEFKNISSVQWEDEDKESSEVLALKLAMKHHIKDVIHYDSIEHKI